MEVGKDYFRNFMWEKLVVPSTINIAYFHQQKKSFICLHYHLQHTLVLAFSLVAWKVFKQKRAKKIKRFRLFILVRTAGNNLIE